MLEGFSKFHKGWADSIRKAYIGKEVVLKRSDYGKMRRGRIIEVLVLDSVTFGIDVYRVDGNGFCAERQWCRPSGIVL